MMEITREILDYIIGRNTLFINQLYAIGSPPETIDHYQRILDRANKRLEQMAPNCIMIEKVWDVDHMPKKRQYVKHPNGQPLCFRTLEAAEHWIDIYSWSLTYCHYEPTKPKPIPRGAHYEV